MVALPNGPGNGEEILMNKVGRFKPLLYALLATGAVTPALAKPSFHGIFTDHAVMQRDRPIVIWGQASASEAALAFAKRWETSAQLTTFHQALT